MKGATPRTLVSVSAALAGAVLLSAAAWAVETGRCVRVVDGDTIKVRLGGRVESVRLIGVNTPETVHPDKPVEYFGREASAFILGLPSRLEGSGTREADDASALEPVPGPG